mmetsp:Transcript_7122/g.21744  ORF Transcript_7122/g.21744 Transcript_7122/m.21744 type:complete len:231 (-) Transcript_7122:41-733(-)
MSRKKGIERSTRKSLRRRSRCIRKVSSSWSDRRSARSARRCCRIDPRRMQPCTVGRRPSETRTRRSSTPPTGRSHGRAKVGPTTRGASSRRRRAPTPRGARLRSRVPTRRRNGTNRRWPRLRSRRSSSRKSTSASCTKSPLSNRSSRTTNSSLTSRRSRSSVARAGSRLGLAVRASMTDALRAAAAMSASCATPPDQRVGDDDGVSPQFAISIVAAQTSEEAILGLCSEP